MAEILSDNRRLNGEPLIDAEQVRILDVVPLSSLHRTHAEALADAAEDIARGSRIGNVVAIVDKASVGILADMKRLMVSAFYSTIYHSLLVSYWAGS